MAFKLENLGLLFGLFALAIPVVLHLLRRRRFEILDWGAMQFLPDSITVQRRRWLDDLLLMLVRMGMIALIVIALATPISTSGWLAPLAGQPARDVVLVFDGSYSMDLRLPNTPTPWQDALGWAQAHLDEASPGDRFAIVIARQPPHFLQEDFTSDFDEIRSKLATLPTPRGNPDMPRTLAAAWQHLQTHSKANAKEIIVLTDRQHFGWADLNTLAALDSLGSQWFAEAERAKNDGLAAPSIRMVKFGADLPGALPNFALASLTMSRGIAKKGQKITFQSALLLDGFLRYVPPREVKISVDGEFQGNLTLPTAIDLKQGPIPLRFEHRFDKEGQHLVSLTLEADPGSDLLMADNAQHAVVEVVKEIPILLVDGDQRLSPESSSFFLRQALAPKQAAKSVATVPYAALTPAMILPEGTDDLKPAVIVLADVPHLQPAQIDALDRFLTQGGGLLLVAGERMAYEKTFYNEHLFRQGEGWLPAALDEIGSSKDGVSLEPRTFQHPALELFRASPDGSMNSSRFSHWWKVKRTPKLEANAIAMLSNSEPFLLEKPYGQGRVILCTVPLDRRWNSTLPNGWEFPILVHELVSYLAANRTGSASLRDGAPIRVSSILAKKQRLTLRTPDWMEQVIDVKSWPWHYANTGAVGVYQVQGSERFEASYIVSPDLRESNLTRCTEDDWHKVQNRLPIVWQSEVSAHASSLAGDGRREEMWWLLLLAVLGMLCLEVWMTRRMALRGFVQAPP